MRMKTIANSDLMAWTRAPKTRAGGEFEAPLKFEGSNRGLIKYFFTSSLQIWY